MRIPKTWVLIIVAVILAVGIGLLSYGLHRGSRSNSSVQPLFTPAAWAALPSSTRAANQVAVFLKISPITFPSIASQTAIGVAALPVDLKQLIPTGARNLETFKTMFSNGRPGFTLIFGMQGPVPDIHAAYLPSKSDWTKLKSAYNGVAGIVVLKDQNFQAQSIETYRSETSTLVSIVALPN
ncbi:MAG: hypothetical protein KGJ13_06580 [Patescibacteria group bacterium]|nr:hypothetical protein [Patescibacteria group bacterium]